LPADAWMAGRNTLRFDVVALVRAMAFNRLCEPRPELGVLHQLEAVVMPKIANEVSRDHLRCGVDVGMNRGTEVETAALCQLLDDALPVFYDLATIRIQGGGQCVPMARTSAPVGLPGSSHWALCRARNQRALLEVGYDLANGVRAIER